MTTDNPGGGDPVRPFTTPLPAGTPAWHSADYWGHGEHPADHLSIEEVVEIRDQDRAVQDRAHKIENSVGSGWEGARNKRAALIAASNVWAGNGGYALQKDIEATAALMLEWLNQ